MIEQHSQQRLLHRFGAEAMQRLGVVVDAVTAEAQRQNLVSAATIREIWTRHVLDSAQLVDHSRSSGLWLDIGSGAGFPGLVVACLIDRRVTLCEPRRLRAEFLREVVAALGFGERVSVEQRKANTLALTASTISARAVAPVGALIAIAGHCATSETEWILPRGASGLDELSLLDSSTRRMFHVERSQSHQDGIILIGQGVTA